MTIAIDESRARVTKRGVIVWVCNGRSYHTITISKASWNLLKRETKRVPAQIVFSQSKDDYETGCLG